MNLINKFKGIFKKKDNPKYHEFITIQLPVSIELLLDEKQENSIVESARNIIKHSRKQIGSKAKFVYISE